MIPLIASLALVAHPGPAPGEIVLPPGFTVRRVAEGLTGATAMEIAPDGRIFLCEQTGSLRVFRDGTLSPRPFVTLDVDSEWERGLIGVALDPGFARNHFVYLCTVVPRPYPHHRIVRWTAEGDVAVPGSEVVLFEGDDQTKLGGTVPSGHQGGAIHFGADGKLYVALGEQTAGEPSQRLDTLLGKLLRLNPDGSIPEDNPFARQAEGKYRAIWALGLRNPFTFAVQPETGRIFLNDVGGEREEINEGHAGANYGWPTVEHGPTADPRFRGPVYHYPTSSVAGGAFCPRSAVPGGFPDAYRGRYFFMDFMKGWIQTLDPENPSSATEFARGLPRPVDLRFAPDGSLYVLTRDMWVKDKDFRPSTGALWQVRFDPSNAPVASAPKPAPPLPAPPPPIAPDPGTYTGPIAVRLTFGEPGDTLRYTTDGREPTLESAAYQSAFTLERSAKVIALAFRDGRSAGKAVAADYRIVGATPYGLRERPVVQGLKIPPSPSGLPSKLSETGIFSRLDDLSPSPGLVPYEVNVPLWSDGAAKRRWIALPGGERIGFRPTGEWTFPAGTVFVKHFEIPLDDGEPRSVRRLETRVLYADGSGGGYGATYRWRPDRSDADLLPAEGARETLRIRGQDGEREQVWSYPGREDCLKCHTTAAGFVLGPKTRQLNRTYRDPATGLADNQLRTWNYLGMFRPSVAEGDIPGMERLVGVEETSAPLEARARSYLDANCANCHRPGANIPASFDARFDVPLARQGMLDGPTRSDSLGIADPRVVAPGDLGRSLLYQRMVRTDRFPMPPLARNRVDEAAAAMLAEWIRDLPAATGSGPGR